MPTGLAIVHWIGCINAIKKYFELKHGMEEFDFMPSFKLLLTLPLLAHKVRISKFNDILH